MNKTDIPIREKNTPHDRQYFVMGNNKIVINEHFNDNGKPLESILEKVILNAGNNQKTA